MAPALAAALGDRGEGAPGTPVLVVLVLRLVALIPLADFATRANAAAALLGGFAVVMLARLALRFLRAHTPLAAAVLPEDDDDDEPLMEPARGPVPVRLAVPAARTTPVRAFPVGLGSVRTKAGEATQSGRPDAGYEDWADAGGESLRAPSAGLVRDASPVTSSIAPAAVGPVPGWAPPGESLLHMGPAQPPLVAHEIFGVVGGVVCPLLAFAIFTTLSSDVDAALSLALITTVWSRLIDFGGRPGTPRRGLTLALLAGLSLGADPLVPLFVCPPVLLVTLRLARQGELWPRLAPIAFAVGCLVLLPFGSGNAHGPIAEAARAIDVLANGRAGESLLTTLVEAAGGFGVVAVLLSFVGVAVLAVHKPRALVFGAVGLVLALAIAVDRGTRTAGAADLIVAALLVVPITLGLVRLAATLGAAAGAGALALAIIATVWPVADGGLVRFSRTGRVPEALLERAYGALAPGAIVDPGSAVMGDLFRYGRALGLRPDLTVVPGALGARSGRSDGPALERLPLAAGADRR